MLTKAGPVAATGAVSVAVGCIAPARRLRRRDRGRCIKLILQRREMERDLYFVLVLLPAAAIVSGRPATTRRSARLCRSAYTPLLVRTATFSTFKLAA